MDTGYNAQITTTRVHSGVRRNSTRIALDVPVVISQDASHHQVVCNEYAQAVNISSSGLSFISVRAHDPGSRLTISVADADRLSTRFAGSGIATVVRRTAGAREKQFLIGARFTTPADTSQLLSDILFLQMRKAQALSEAFPSTEPNESLENVLKHVSKAAAEALEAEAVFLFFPDSKTQLCAVDANSDRTIRLSSKKGLLAHAAKLETALSLVDPSHHHLYFAESDGPVRQDTHSMLCVPIPAESHTMAGMLLALNSRTGVFGESDKIVGNAICNQLTTVLREISLRESNNALTTLHQRMLNDLPVAVANIDPDGRLTFANRAAANMLGLSMKRDIGKEITDIFDPVLNSKFVRLISSANEKLRRQTAYDVQVARNGVPSSSLNVRLIPTSSLRDAHTGVLLIAEDITKEQRFISTLSRYLAREVTEQILTDEALNHLGGTKLEASILIADIRNFSQLAENMDPSALMSLLNDYFSPMINVIFRHRGMVDKFMGDALLAVFGPPVPQSDDPLRAARAALEMQSELVRLNETLCKHWGVSLEIGIGITSGTVISGNIGSERRMDYTVIGEPVNLAARLEGLTKEVQRKILISKSVYRCISGVISCEPLGQYYVKGKSDKVDVYALC